MSQTEGWKGEDYRYYLDAYRHYTALLDENVGKILAALSNRADAADTLVVFFADHGDGMGAHRMVTKQVSFIDETTRIPLAFAGPGVDRDASRARDVLTSTMDLLPTLCDYAGIRAPGALWGRSLVPWFAGDTGGSPHSYVASEWQTEWAFTVSPGRMIRTPRFKYTRYLEHDGQELYDMWEDPGETHTLAHSAQHVPALEEHRRLLREHVHATADDFFALSWNVDPRWRRHAPGYHRHRGPAAPMIED
jgi:choline-sulfatase